MKFIIKNFLSLILLTLLLINVFMVRDLKVKHNELSSQNSMLRLSVVDLTKRINSNNQQSVQVEKVDEVMTPTELAKYLKIEMSMVYELATSDKTMPYIIVNSEYRFNKAAIDKWMETQKSIEIR